MPGSDARFIHIDTYRLEEVGELKRLGIEKRINNKDLIVIEWADKFRSVIEELGSEARIVWVEMGYGETENERLITFDVK